MGPPLADLSDVTLADEDTNSPETTAWVQTSGPLAIFRMTMLAKKGLGSA